MTGLGPTVYIALYSTYYIQIVPVDYGKKKKTKEKKKEEKKRKGKKEKRKSGFKIWARVGSGHDRR